MANELKERFFEMYNKAVSDGKIDRIRQNTGVYTVEMLRALKDMAEANVYPDGRFSDDECIVWSFFR